MARDGKVLRQAHGDRDAGGDRGTPSRAPDDACDPRDRVVCHYECDATEERFSSAGEVITWIREHAPAGEYECWKYHGSDSEPVFVVSKSGDGRIAVIETLFDDRDESEWRYADESVGRFW